jgi:hypothetical protein
MSFLAKIPAAFMAYGKRNIGCPKPDMTFPIHLMFSIFVVGYSMEYIALGRELKIS